MTAIVAISIGRSVYLVADTLSSGNVITKYQTNDTLTLSTGIVVDPDTVPRTEFAEDALKIARMHGNLAVGFSGYIQSGHDALEFIARVKIERLDTLRSVISDVLLNRVPPGQPISLIGFIVLDGIIHKFKAKLTEPPQSELDYSVSSAYEDIFFIGTGGESLKSTIQSTTYLGNDDDSDETYENRIAILAYLYKEYYASQAIRDLSPIRQYFGGALVCLFSTEDEIEWQKPMSIVLVQAMGKGATVKLSQMPHFQYSEIINEKLLLLHTDSKKMDLPQIKIITNSLSIDEAFSLSDFEKRASFNAEWIVYYLIFDMHGEHESFAVFMQEGQPAFIDDRSPDGKLIGMQISSSWNFHETVYIGDNHIHRGSEAVKRYLIDYLKDYENSAPHEKKHIFSKIADFRINNSTDNPTDDPYHFHRVLGWRMKYKGACNREATSPRQLTDFIKINSPLELTTHPSLKDSIERYLKSGSFRTVECVICEQCNNFVVDKYWSTKGNDKANISDGTLITTPDHMIDGVKVFDFHCGNCENLVIKELPQTDFSIQ